MEELFLKLLNMSISAAWIVLAVVILRLVLKKAPRYIICLLWALVAIRLLFPFSIESTLSLIPSAETVPETIFYDKNPAIHTGIEFVNNAVNPIIGQSLAATPELSANPTQKLTLIASVIWIAGMAAMAVYSIISYFSIKYRVRASLVCEKGVYICDNIDTPFILGIIFPRIYMPSSMAEESVGYVIAHEKAHLRRLDHIWKPLGFLLLAVYWFNPVLWLGYILLCRDIELACDEKVVREMGAEDKKAYSHALLNCSVPRRMISACPLAFGEVGVKERVKKVLSYKKPAFWIILLAIISAVAATVCLLTDPVTKNIPDTVTVLEGGSDKDGVSLEIIGVDLEGQFPYIQTKWKNRTVKSYTFGDPFTIYRNVDGEWVDCSMSESVWLSIGYMLSPMGNADKKYNLYNNDLTEEGTYRLEAEFFEDGNPGSEYKLWVDFQLSQGVPMINVRQYKAVERVFDCGVYSYVMSPEAAPSYRLTELENQLVLQEKYQTDLNYLSISGMREVPLNEENFDSLLTNSPIWEKEGLSAKALRENNKRAWKSDVDGQYLYIFLEQENGDVYICIGNADHIRWIFLLEETAVESDPPQKTLIYKGLHYSKTDISFDKLDDSWEYKGTVTEQMANNTELSGLRYFTVPGEPQSIYVEYSEREYVLWISARAEADAVETVKYLCTESNENIIFPAITLYPETGRFMFSYSAFSSNVPMGTYEISGTKLTLNCDGGKTYVFNMDRRNFRFDADGSDELPKYRYSGVDEPMYPFEDGALFERVYEVSSGPLFEYDFAETVTGDVDGDGTEEEIKTGPGPTSGIFTFTLTAYENGEAEYFNIFTSEFQYLSFVKDKKGKLLLRGETQGNTPQVHYFEITVEEGNIVLTDNGNKLGYWGEQGLSSSWYTRYQ